VAALLNVTGPRFPPLYRALPFDMIFCYENKLYPASRVAMDYEDYKKISNAPLEHFATLHPTITDVIELFDRLEAFKEAKWAFRGQGTDHVLAASIKGLRLNRALPRYYVVREFRRRAHQYVTDVPSDDDDLEWLALMQHHGAPTRLLDWTRSPHVAPSSLRSPRIQLVRSSRQNQASQLSPSSYGLSMWTASTPRRSLC